MFLFQAGFSTIYQEHRDSASGPDDDDGEPNVRCTHCYREERVVDFDDMKRGDHIRMGGRHSMFNKKDRQVTFYNHHAIVKHVEKVTQSHGFVTFIHFYTESFDASIKIRETTELVYLRYYELYKVRYAHITHSPDDIIERATRLTNSDRPYSVFNANCEHFCHWCCTGNAESYQLTDMLTKLRQIADGIQIIAGKYALIVRYFAKATMIALDDVAAGTMGFKDVLHIPVPWGVIGIMVIAYLLYCLCYHIYLYRSMAQGNMCASCYRREIKASWIKFFLYCGLQVGGMKLLSLLMAVCQTNCIVIGAMVVMAVVSIGIQYKLPALLDDLRSPFKGKKVTARNTANILVGNVISFKYRLKMHDGTVSKVERRTHKKARVSVIHYSEPSLMGSRVVQKETFDFDLSRDKIVCHDYTGYNVHPPEVVVQRATQRLGETKFGILSNRSCHFCYWAKVNEDIDDAHIENPGPTPVLLYERSLEIGEDISGLRQANVDHGIDRKETTTRIGVTLARIPQDVKEGAVIQFKYNRLRRWHYAVTTGVHHTREPSSKLSVTVVHYGAGNEPCEETIDFDLCVDDIYIYKYHPLYRYSRKHVIRRARMRVGQGKYHAMKYRSIDLAEDIVRKYKDELVTSFDNVHEGDVIIFYYWNLQHAAVVVNVVGSSLVANNKANITLIHYVRDRLFINIIKQETMFKDLSRDHVYRRNYEEVTYPADVVVRRAKKRLGEQWFGLLNPSWELVHWAKVVQTPAIVKKCYDYSDKATVTVPEQEEKIAILPQVGKVHGYFQNVRVHCWSDLQPGIIIEYRYYWIWHQAILVDVDYNAKTITVIHYGTDTIISTRTIMKDTLRVDPKRDELWMYRCNPNVCSRPEVIVAKANKRLREKKWWFFGNKSWDFCKACVLKQ